LALLQMFASRVRKSQFFTPAGRPIVGFQRAWGK
jgi:hypothetical protein